MLRPKTKQTKKPTKTGQVNETEIPGWIFTQPDPWPRSWLTLVPQASLLLSRLGLLLTTLGGEQREKCKTRRERRGEVQAFPAVNYSVYWGRTAVAQRSHEKKQRSQDRLPRHPRLHPRAAVSAAAEQNHDGRGGKSVRR